MSLLQCYRQFNTLRLKAACITSITRSLASSKELQPKFSPRMEEFKKKLQEDFHVEKPLGREVTPIRKLDQKNLKHPKEFEFEPFPNDTNPVTGEIGGPKGPEPTRYGDWERKGRCIDF